MSAVAEDVLPMQAVWDEVARFAAHSLEPAVARHEHPLTPERQRDIRDVAAEMGLVSADAGDPSGLALWECDAAADNRRLSIGALRRLGRINMGFAWQLHQSALARWLERRLRFDAPGWNVVALQGRYGLARGSLSRYLRGRADAEDLALLQDYFDADSAPGLLVHCAPDWSGIWLPRLGAERSLQWQYHPRERLRVSALPHSHGLDELCSYAVQRGEADTPTSALAPDASRDVMTELCALNTLGLLAVALGGVEHAHALALDYAATRRQGAQLIREHAAVQLLLGQGRQAIALTEQMLDSACGQAGDSPLALARLYRSRAALQPMLCRGSSDALQVFGGMGYMRDTGLEKILRDQNCLRVIHGTPLELQLAATALEEDAS